MVVDTRVVDGATVDAIRLAGPDGADDVWMLQLELATLRSTVAQMERRLTSDEQSLDALTRANDALTQALNETRRVLYLLVQERIGGEG